MADLAHCIQNSSVATPEAGRRGALYRFEVFLADTAEGAYPIVGDLFKRRARVYSTVRISHLGIINVVAYGTSVLSHFSLNFSLDGGKNRMDCRPERRRTEA